MSTMKKSLLASAIAAASVGSFAHAQDSDFMTAMKDGKTALNFRFRVEDVSQDGAEDATAQTMRIRLNHATGTYAGFSGFVEFDQVSELIEADYTDGVTPRGTAVIADPENTDWNQGYIQYSDDGLTVKAGRQRILLDNQRFIGGVGWRQNEQTYDALSVSYAVNGFTITYAHIANVNTIWGTDRDSKDDLLNVKYKLNDAFSVTGYGYFLSLDDVDDSDNDTIGIAFDGSLSDFTYHAEFASQETDAYEASYLALNGSYKISNAKLGAGYEVLGADGSNGQFDTPYGTKHAFQGWADKFLATPPGGLVDVYLTAGLKAGPVNLTAVYHDFKSDDEDIGTDDLGSEFDFLVGGKAGPVALTLKYADYRVDNDAAVQTDTQKLWLMAEVTF